MLSFKNAVSIVALTIAVSMASTLTMASENAGVMESGRNNNGTFDQNRTAQRSDAQRVGGQVFKVQGSLAKCCAPARTTQGHCRIGHNWMERSTLRRTR